MSKATKQYFVQLVTSLVIYGVLLAISIWLLQHDLGFGWRVAVALLPMLPATAMLFAFVRLLGQMDELQRRIQLEALGFAFGGTALLTFGYGFLQNIAFPQLSWLFVWPLMATLWIIGVTIAKRKYQ